MALRILLTVCLCTLTATALAGKKKKAPKPKREPKPLVRAGHKQVIASGSKTHEVTVRVSRAEKGATGYIFAIYKSNSGGGVYTCRKEEIKVEAKKPDKKSNQKNKKTKEKEPKQEPMKFTFPHSNGNGTFVDYLVVLYQGGTIVSRASQTSIWKNAAENLVDNSETTFNSRGEAIDAVEGEDDGHALDDDVVKAGLRLKSRIEAERKNKKMMKEMNK